MLRGIQANGNNIVWEASVDKTNCKLFLIGDAFDEKDLRFWTRYEGPEPEGDFEFLVKDQLRGRLKEAFFSHTHYDYELGEDYPFGISTNRWGNRDTKAPKAIENIATARLFLGFVHQTDCFFPDFPSQTELKGARSNAGGESKDLQWHRSQFNDLAVNSRKFHTASNDNILYGDFGTEIKTFLRIHGYLEGSKPSPVGDKKGSVAETAAFYDSLVKQVIIPTDFLFPRIKFDLLQGCFENSKAARALFTRSTGKHYALDVSKLAKLTLLPFDEWLWCQTMRIAWLAMDTLLLGFSKNTKKRYLDGKITALSVARNFPQLVTPLVASSEVTLPPVFRAPQPRRVKRALYYEQRKRIVYNRTVVQGDSKGQLKKAVYLPPSKTGTKRSSSPSNKDGPPEKKSRQSTD